MEMEWQPDSSLNVHRVTVTDDNVSKVGFYLSYPNIKEWRSVRYDQKLWYFCA